MMLGVLAKVIRALFFFTLTINFSFNSNVYAKRCRENEQQALESAKKHIYDPTDFMSSWIVGKDCCEWEGVVCHNLTHHVIELNMDGYDSMRINNLQWLSNLSYLEHLNIDSVDLSKVTNWLQDINMFPSLLLLRLYNCRLFHIPPHLFHHNFSSLQSLDLSSNNFSAPVPKWVFNLVSLVFLDLSSSNFIGPFPEGPVNLTSLTTFEASDNSFNCLLPKWLFSDLNNLESLNLTNSDIEGEIQSNTGNVTKLKQLDLSGNYLNSTIPNWLHQCKNLELLKLQGNNLEGTLPESLGLLRNLEYLGICDNMLEGIVTESHFTGLRRLEYFLASGNNLTLKVRKKWIPPFQLLWIHIGGWNIGAHFPNWIKTQKQMERIDISNGGIQGEVPSWFWKLSSQFEFLNLSHNQFVGEVKVNSIRGPSYWYLGSNNFSGSLPRISTNVIQLALSNNSFSKGLSNLLCEPKNESYLLEFLNLGGNDLSEKIPDCWMNWPELTVLILRENNLRGVIPSSIKFLSHLRSLDFRRNILTGPFPTSLENCTELLKIDLDENKFAGHLPPWLGLRLSHLIILSLRSNRFHGELVPELCYLKNLQILDLAENGFTGAIPMCVSNFSAMVRGKMIVEDGRDELNYLFYLGSMRERAIVTTKGNTYQYDTILELFTSMDLSSNNLSGDIPISLTNLVGLRSVNISRNHLSGPIPNDIGK